MKKGFVLGLLFALVGCGQQRDENQSLWIFDNSNAALDVVSSCGKQWEILEQDWMVSQEPPGKFESFSAVSKKYKCVVDLIPEKDQLADGVTGQLFGLEGKALLAKLKVDGFRIARVRVSFYDLREMEFFLPGTLEP